MNHTNKALLWITLFSLAGTLNIVLALLTYSGRYEWLGDVVISSLCFVAAYRIWQTRS